ncbi:MAG TPA: methyltransferase domain-containing protein, partial [Actinomycetota bacterium]|nr:methyltransferase domain-containing protein [Actinomycetota bacterium]
MSQLVFDEALAAQLETLYRTRDVLRRRRLVREALRAGPGDRVLDVGCGPGFYLAELVGQVGPTGSVTGVDASPQTLELARRRTEGRDNVELHLADATALPVPDGAFDAALSVQVLEYVTDLDAALAELHRAVAPGGRVVIWDVDWSTVSWHSTDPARMARVLAAWDGHLADPSLPRTLAARLRAAGFTGVTAEGHAFATTELTPDAYGAAIVPLVERYVAGRDGITEDEAAAWAAELGELGKRGEFFFACVQFCFT